jgi:Tol biopolymer transport system component
MPWVAVAVLTLAAGGAAVWRFGPWQASAPPLRVIPLTSYPGLERYPTFSPDGRQVAFSWNGEKQDNFDIYVKLLDAGEPLRLTTHPGQDAWPGWSPDGRLIAFGRWVFGSRNIEVLTVPALGGAERRIGEFPIPPQVGPNVPAVCWTPDAKWIVASHRPAQNAPEALALLSVQTLEVRPLAAPVPGSAGDCCPAMAPDGRTLAFLRATAGRIWDIYILPLGPDYRPVGQPRQVTHEPSGATNPMWAAGGRELLYIASREGVRTLLRIPHDRSRPAAPIEALGPIGFLWAISPQGNRLAYSDRVGGADIWRLDLTAGNRHSRVLSSSVSDLNPEIAPDGKRSAFISNRARGWRVWVSELDGTNSIDIATTVGLHSGSPRWSPDGRQIVFECRDEGNDDVCAVPAGGGVVRRLTRHPARDSLPSWSRDGGSVYFASNRSGSFQVWKAPADGSEAGAVQLTKAGGLSPVESPDGTNVYFVREGLSSGIWRVPAGGGAESQVGDFEIFGCRSQNFAVAGDGIYYASSADPERWFELWFYRLSSGHSERIGRIERKLWEGLSVSPDGRWLLFSGFDNTRSGDLYLVENFR